MPAKKISVGHGYEIRFDQRARGEETPYWNGSIFKNGEQVGVFNNGGRGGPTTIKGINGNGTGVVEDFLKIVDDSATKQGIKNFSKNFSMIEREGLVLEVAEAIGYNKAAKQFAGEPQLVIDEFVRQTAEIMKKYVQH